MACTRRLYRTILLAFTAVVAIADPKSKPIWGTYRPHALVSVRARVPHSPIFGFVYHSLYNTDLRHLASDRDDAIRSFSWRRHDGEYGDQIIQDTALNLRIRTQFVPREGAWALRFSAEPLNAAQPSTPISVVFYGAAAPETREYARAQDEGGASFNTRRVGQNVEINGEDGAVGKFRVILNEPTAGSVASVGESREQGASDASHTRLRKRSDNLQTRIGGLARFFTAAITGRTERAWMIENHLAQKYMQQLQSSQDEGNPSTMPMRLGDEKVNAASGLLVQRIVQAPFSLDAVFHSSNSIEPDFDRDAIAAQIKERDQAFDTRFDQVFGLSQRGVPNDEVEFAKVALSNVLGGIGFFHGQSIAENPLARNGVELLEPIDLLTATPSRSSFPRGFLWDEGFHQLIIQRWNQELSEDCMRSWLSLIQTSGWIPREQILGTEAQARFPQHIQHLLVQKPDIANPPTLFLPLRVLAKMLLAEKLSGNSVDANKSEDEKVCVAGTDGVCRAEAQAEVTTESGTKVREEFLKSSAQQMSVYFEWLRETQAGAEPDTFRWRGRRAHEVPGKGGYPLTLASGIDDYPRGRTPDDTERHVDLQAWMAWAAGALAEMTSAFGGDSARYRDLQARYTKKLATDYYSRTHKLLCDHTGPQADCHEGYVTLLPFALGLLAPDDALVGGALDALESEARLRSVAGVRSLSATDPAYRLGDDYWTGPVWMPFNYLILAALRTKYAVEDGPYRARAESLFHRLRENVLSNAYRVWKETGLFWENYEPDLGSGRRGRQFTGWSALVLLIYADMYQGIIA